MIGRSERGEQQDSYEGKGAHGDAHHHSRLLDGLYSASSTHMISVFTNIQSLSMCVPQRYLSIKEASITNLSSYPLLRVSLTRLPTLSLRLVLYPFPLLLVVC